MALLVEQTHQDRNDKGFFAVLPWGGSAALPQGEGVALAHCVVHSTGVHLWGACLRVPAFKSTQVLVQGRARIGIGNGLCKVVAGDGLSVMALKVQGHAPGKTSATQIVLGLGEQGLHHAHQLGPFFVHGDGVEVVDFLVAVGAHRVGHGPCVLGKLHIAQQAHVFNALDRARRWRARQVLAELLVAKNGQALFERELKPIAAGDAVACPVVEVLVCHHAFDVGVVNIGGCGGAGQHVFGVEDVQALVFHRPHIEVGRGHNHESVQVQTQTKAGFVPGDAGHQ